MLQLCDPQKYKAENITVKNHGTSALFARIDQLLNERHGRISNSELASLLKYDGSYIGRVVKKTTGKSLFDYSMTFTMNYTAGLLTTTDISVSQIVEDLNFSNRSHFYQIFKEYYGVTPIEYRRQQQTYVSPEM